MTTGRRQSGMSILGMLCILLMLGFFAMCIVRMSAPYFEYLSVKDIISKLATETDPENTSIGDIKRKIANIFNSNQIYLLQPSEVEVLHRNGKIYIDSNYEVRLPIMGRIDAVLKFDDLIYQVGNPEPVAALPAAKD